MAALAFVGGRLLTMEPGGQADVLIVEGDRITAVGPRSILASRPDAEVVDLEGRTLLPGFIDAHVGRGRARLRQILTTGDADNSCAPRWSMQTRRCHP